MGGNAGTASSGSFGTTSGSSTSSGAGGACGNMTLMQKTEPGNLVVVFDQSDSMNQASFATGSGPKYKVAEDAIAMAIGADASLLQRRRDLLPDDRDGKRTLQQGRPDRHAAPDRYRTRIAMFVTDFKAHFAAPGWTLILGTPTVLMH